MKASSNEHSAKQLMEVRNGPGAAILPPNVTKLHLEFAHKWNNGHLGPRKFWREHLPRLKYHNPAIPMIVNRTFNQDDAAVLTVYMRDDGSAPLLLDAPASPTPKAKAETKSTPTASTSADESSTPQPPAAGDPAAAETSSKTKTTDAATQPSKKATESLDPWAHIASSTDGSATAPPPARGERAITISMRRAHSDEIWRRLAEATGARDCETTEEDRVEIERLARLREQAAKDRAVQKKFRDGIKAEKQMLERARKEADALKGE